MLNVEYCNIVIAPYFLNQTCTWIVQDYSHILENRILFCTLVKTELMISHAVLATADGGMEEVAKLTLVNSHHTNNSISVLQRWHLTVACSRLYH